MKLLRRAVRLGSLALIDPWGERHVVGTGDAPFVTVRLTEPGEAARLLASPSLRAGEAYMDGSLVIEEGSLRDFLLIGVAAAGELANEARAVKEIAAPLTKLRRHNPIARARANVAHHYDLSEEFYTLFLDDDLQYSCAYFQSGDESLEAAQAKKKRHIAAKLRLQPGAKVLDVGSGWGGMALELARSCGARVDGLTLSQEQLAVAQARAGAEGLQDRVRFHLRDYREEAGVYDRIVSVGMFEHVGVPHYGEFFDMVRERLAPDGVALIHAIGRKDPPSDSDPWIDKYIFPGGYCPSLSEVFAAIEKSGLWVTDMEVLRLHYAETLSRWYERFQAGRDTAARLYDERFCRMWEFYLAACEAGFRVGSLMVFQIQLARDVAALPLTRDYMVDNERRLAGT
ncbi:cyclopropane-fatty-acyl-phospholipid synthase (plasmid) [Phenylobacterium zucineum HLK1]|uniref:Cyclopropane-fatty-acyl-phospholipid synthase n=1 Tax=Phenylobacterium zucineum (strain HLK1) TaxID=450851 RepID=B4RIF8_PHEZH|nr:cyclopropane-fatty-acyl-phospholipid synthase [Phenylobacterium zucineum HLK1]